MCVRVLVIEKPKIFFLIFLILQDYGVEIVLFHSNLLVDIEVEKIGRVLKLDSIKDGQIWKNFDLLIFNTWLWYTRRPPGQQYVVSFIFNLILYVKTVSCRNIR